LLHGARHAILLVLMLLLVVVLVLMLAVLVLYLLVATDALEVWAGKSCGSAGLEWAAEEQLGRQKGGELHIECGTGSGHVVAIVGSLLLLVLLLA
jgi:hypothetical protein